MEAKDDGYRGMDRYPVGADSISALFVCTLFREHMECSPTAMRSPNRERYGYPFLASLREGGGFADGKDGGSTRP